MTIFYHMPPTEESLLCAARVPLDSNERIQYHWEFFIASFDGEGVFDNSIDCRMGRVVWWTGIKSLLHDAQQDRGPQQLPWRDGLPCLQFYSSVGLIFEVFTSHNVMWRCYLAPLRQLRESVYNVPDGVTIQFRWLPLSDLEAHLDSLEHMP